MARKLIQTRKEIRLKNILSVFVERLASALREVKMVGAQRRTQNNEWRFVNYNPSKTFLRLSVGRCHAWWQIKFMKEDEAKKRVKEVRAWRCAKNDGWRFVNYGPSKTFPRFSIGMEYMTIPKIKKEIKLKSMLKEMEYVGAWKRTQKRWMKVRKLRSLQNISYILNEM